MIGSPKRAIAAQAGFAAALIAAALALTSCTLSIKSTPTAPDATAVVTRTVTQQVTVTASVTPAPPAAVAPATVVSPTPSRAAGAARVAPFTMPPEEGKVLQDAKHDLQAAAGNPFFPSYSNDALGAGRMQVMEQNWRVCGQNVPAGRTVASGTRVTFEVVQLTETCP